MDIQRAKELVCMLRTVPLPEPHQVRLRELCDIIDPPASQPVELLPREHRVRQEPGFAMIAPTDWIETTERWHARCEAHRRAAEYKTRIEGDRGVWSRQIARDCIEWIEHQTEMYILRVIADALDLSWPDTADTVDTYKRRITFHIGALYA